MDPHLGYRASIEERTRHLHPIRLNESVLICSLRRLVTFHSAHFESSTVYESQSQNADDCLARVLHSKCNIGRDIDWCRKLHFLIIDASSAPIIQTPAPEQKKKVEELVKLEKARRRAEKDHHSEVKKGRRGDNNW